MHYIQKWQLHSQLPLSIINVILININIPSTEKRALRGSTAEYVLYERFITRWTTTYACKIDSWKLILVKWLIKISTICYAELLLSISRKNKLPLLVFLPPCL